jgi:hypothetical protein
LPLIIGSSASVEKEFHYLDLFIDGGGCQGTFELDIKFNVDGWNGAAQKTVNIDNGTETYTLFKVKRIRVPISMRGTILSIEIARKASSPTSASRPFSLISANVGWGPTSSSRQPTYNDGI